VELSGRLSRIDERGPRWQRISPDAVLDTRHSSERDHDIAATLDASRMLVESEV
jgi:hypothetical protein